MDFVNTKEQIAKNLVRFARYESSSRSLQVNYFRERLQKGTNFVVAVSSGDFLFCPSRFVGYADCTVEKHQAFREKHGGKTTPQISKILGGPPQSNTDLEKRYEAKCASLSIKPDNKERAYWLIDLCESDVASDVPEGVNGYPGEVPQYIEGATKQIYVNAFERDPAARKKCLDHHGFECTVCKLDFSKRYGDTGKEFIHVHHLHPLHLGKGPRNTNPVSDLRPVCPNCHAMLHRSDPPFTIEEMINIMRNANGN